MELPLRLLRRYRAGSYDQPESGRFRRPRAEHPYGSYSIVMRVWEDCEHED